MIKRTVFLASLAAISLSAEARNILVLMDSEKEINQGLKVWIEYQVAAFPHHSVQFAEYDSRSDLVFAITSVGSRDPIDTLIIAEHSNRHAIGTGERNITDKNAQYILDGLERYFAPDANALLIGCLAGVGLFGNNIAKELSEVMQVTVQAPTYEYIGANNVPGFVPSVASMELRLGRDGKVWFNDRNYRLCLDSEQNRFRNFVTTVYNQQRVLIPSRPVIRTFENGRNTRTPRY